MDEEGLSAEIRRRAGHYEVLGETYAKFEFFEQGWNPYSRFLDVDKVDLVLRRRVSAEIVYRDVQVKYGKLYRIGKEWEKSFFDLTSWRFFRETEFDEYLDDERFFIAYVLSADTGYRGDIFIFPVRDFAAILRAAIPTKGQRKVYISRLRDSPERWVLRLLNRFAALDEASVLDVSRYRRNFESLHASVPQVR